MHTIMSAKPLQDLSALEVHHLYKLRVDVFVNEQQCPYAEIDDIDALPTTLHITAWENEELAGVARLFPDEIDGEKVAHFGRFVVAPSHRGSGLSQGIMNHALRLCDEHFPHQPVFLTAQAPLETYYGSFGFTRCGETFDDEGIPHVPMKKSS